MRDIQGMTTMTNKTLLISSDALNTRSIDQVAWSDDLPNLSEYDIIVIDTTSLVSLWSQKAKLSDGVYFLDKPNKTDAKLTSSLSLIQKKIAELLQYKVSVYAIYEPSLVLWTHGDSYDVFLRPGRCRFASTNDWCPISIDVVPEKGGQIHVKDKVYKRYFDKLRDWQYYFLPKTIDISRLTEYYSHRSQEIACVHSIIAEGKRGEALALSLSFSLCNPGKLAAATTLSVATKRRSRIESQGQLMLLPSGMNNNLLIDIILQIAEPLDETPEPLWLVDIQMPNETRLNERLRQLKQETQDGEAQLETQPKSHS